MTENIYPDDLEPSLGTEPDSRLSPSIGSNIDEAEAEAFNAWIFLSERELQAAIQDIAKAIEIRPDLYENLLRENGIKPKFPLRSAPGENIVAFLKALEWTRNLFMRLDPSVHIKSPGICWRMDSLRKESEP